MVFSGLIEPTEEQTGEGAFLDGIRSRAAKSVEPQTNLRRIRMRLRLALIAVVLVPIAVALAVLKFMSPGPLPIEVFALPALMVLLALPLVYVIPRVVLLGTEHLEKATDEMQRVQDVTRADSLRDGLTGLGNHRAFQEELDRQLDLNNRYRVEIALLLIDLDDLKLVNDSDGHAAGDEMLRDLGRLIHQSVRFSDRAFRVGADEFAILMPHTNGVAALEVAKRLQQRAAKPAQGSRPIRFSGGISSCPDLASTRSQLYAQADAALSWCKRHGRSSIDVFHPVRDRVGPSMEPTDELTASISRVVTEARLRPVYQPIVDLVSGRVIGFEGLIRPSPESGFADPASMFIAADTVGRTVELDYACLQAVVAGAQPIPQEQLLTLNISPRTVEAPQFSAETLLAMLVGNNIAPQRVVIELTERETVEDVSRLQANLVALQRAGVRIAADDVGAGNSGLRLLSQIRFDIVKIDLTLVQEGAERASSQAVLRSLRDLAGRWGASVIAEGLETVGQLRTVRELGVTAGQGYLLGRPTPNPQLSHVDLGALQPGSMVLERTMSGLEGAIPAPAH